MGEPEQRQSPPSYNLPNHAKKQASARKGGGLLCFYLLRDIGLGDGRIQLIGGRGGVHSCFSALLLLAGRFLLFGLAALGAALAANALCQQQEQHQQGRAAGAERPDGKFAGHKGHFHFGAGDGEGGVAAEAARLHSLPAAVGLLDVDLALGLARGQVADLMGLIAVVGELQQPLLSDAMDVGCDVLLGDLHRVGAAEEAVHIEDRATVLTGHAAAQRRDVGGILHIHYGVGVEGIQHGGAPLGVVALLLGDLRVVGLREGRAVVEADLLDGVAVSLEDEVQLAEGRGQALLREQGLISDRLGLPGPAQAVDALQVVGDEEVAHEAAVLTAGDGAHILLACQHRDEGAVVDGDKTAVGEVAVAALTHDAADVLLTAEGAFCPVAAELGAGRTGNAAHLIDAGDVAVGLAGRHKAQLLLTHDAADHVLLGGNAALVGVADEDGANGVGGAQERGALVLVVLLGVQQVLDAHGAGDAAHIHVGVDGAPVDAVLDLAVGLGGDEVFGLILIDGLAARVADLLHGVQHQVGHDADLCGHSPHLGGQLLAGGPHGAVDVLHLIGQAADRIKEGVLGVGQLRRGTGHLDGVLLVEPVEDVAGLAHHIGQPAEAVLQLAQRHRGMDQRCAGEGGVGLEQVDGVAQVVHAIAELIGRISQPFDAALDVVCAVQTADPVLDAAHDVVGDAAHPGQGVRGLGQGRRQLGMVGGRDGLSRTAHDAAHLGRDGGDGSDGAGDLRGRTGDVTVVGQEGRCPQQAHACGDGLHGRREAAAQRKDAGHRVGHLQQLDAGLEVLIGLCIRGEGVVGREDAGDGLRGGGVVAGVDGFQQPLDAVGDAMQAVAVICGGV